MRARVRDTEIYFDVDGAGLVAEGHGMRERLTAFLLQGGPGFDHSNMKRGYGRLSEAMQLVYHDYRGHGRSDLGDSRNYTLDENVEDLEALRNHLGLGPIVSIGVSYGGEVAMAHAARYPDSVSHLVLIATTSHGGIGARAKRLVRERGTPEQAAQCDRLFAGELDSVEKIRQYSEVMGALYTTRVYDPALANAALERANISSEAFIRAHGPTGFQRTLDLRPELKNITASTLIIAGRHDPICAPEFSAEIHGLIPGSDFRIFESSSHLVASDEPQRLYDVIVSFLTDGAGSETSV